MLVVALPFSCTFDDMLLLLVLVLKLAPKGCTRTAQSEKHAHTHSYTDESSKFGPGGRETDTEAGTTKKHVTQMVNRRLLLLLLC